LYSPLSSEILHAAGGEKGEKGEGVIGPEGRGCPGCRHFRRFKGGEEGEGGTKERGDDLPSLTNYAHLVRRGREKSGEGRGGKTLVPSLQGEKKKGRGGIAKLEGRLFAIIEIMLAQQ